MGSQMYDSKVHIWCLFKVYSGTIGEKLNIIERKIRKNLNFPVYKNLPNYWDEF